MSQYISFKNIYMDIYFFFLSAILLIAAFIPMAGLFYFLYFFPSGPCGGLGSKAVVTSFGQTCRNKKQVSIFEMELVETLGIIMLLFED